VRDSIVCAGSIVSGASVDSSVIGTHTFVSDGAAIQRSVLLDNVSIGRGAVIRNAILDKNIVVPDGAIIGVDHDEDRRRGFSVSEGGITVLGKGQIVER
jgi:glucose-1-phosphate adenylyltransferase